MLAVKPPFGFRGSPESANKRCRTVRDVALPRAVVPGLEGPGVVGCVWSGGSGSVHAVAGGRIADQVDHPVKARRVEHS